MCLDAIATPALVVDKALSNFDLDSKQVHKYQNEARTSNPHNEKGASHKHQEHSHRGVLSLSV